MGAWAELAEYVDVHLAPRGAEAAVDLAGLSEAERRRTALFKRAADAHRYAGGRAYLRRVLAAYLDCLPGDVPLRQADPLAKPYVAPSYGLDFSLARAGSGFAVAVARGRQVGVDLEAWAGRGGGRDGEALPLAAALAEGEADELDRVPEAARRRAFLSIWTRKEAVVKAPGWGLGDLPPQAFTVPRAAPPDAAADGVWTAYPAPKPLAGLWHLAVAEWREPGFTVAVALRGAYAAPRLLSPANPARN